MVMFDGRHLFRGTAIPSRHFVRDTFSGVVAMRNLFTGFLAALVGLSSVALAQNPPVAQPRQPAVGGQRQPGQPAIQPGQPGVVQPGVPGQPGQPLLTGQRTQQGTSDQQIAACICGAAHNEIEIAKFADSKLQTDEVREFAQRMVREHTPGCEAMKQKAGDLVANIRTSRDEGEGAPRRDATTGAEPRPAAGTTGGQLDWVSIHQQIGEQCLANAKKELATQQGTDFDRTFIGMQCMAHLQMIDALKVLRNYASNDLRQNIDQELQLANTHLTQAKQIKEQLKDRSSDRLSRRPEGKQ
jgi:predicted outer membrane protein